MAERLIEMLLLLLLMVVQQRLGLVYHHRLSWSW